MNARLITDQLLLSFERYLRENEKAQATIQKYRRDIRFFLNYAADRVCEKTLILNYKDMLGKQYLVSSANSMLAALNALFRFAGWYELCVKPFKMQRETYRSEEKILTRQEYEALVEAAKRKKNAQLALLVQTICATGIRVSELQHITVEAVRQGEAIVSCKGKTRKIFIVKPLQKKLLQYTAKQGITGGILFVTKHGNPLNRSNVWRQMKELCKTAGVSPQKVFPHNLRHLFARTFYRIEKDIAKLADILGHSNVNTTRLYIITSGAEHRRHMETMRLII